jgi:DNA polymerase elongation subunit (family B)
MKLNNFFVYSWHIDEREKEVTSIRAYGVNKQRQNICLRINDFTPYVYVELPSNLQWNENKAQMVGNKIDEITGNYKPIKKCLVYKKKLYYAHLNQNDSRKEFPFLFLAFSSVSDIKNFIYKCNKTISVSGIGMMKLKVHEQDASPILQLTCARDIPTSGWISFSGKRVEDEEKITFCDEEYIVRWKNLEPLKINEAVSPLIMGYDIEVYSSDPNKMPNAKKARDVVFQISCVFARNGDKEDRYEKYLLSLFDPDPDTVGEDVNLYLYDSEMTLLKGFVDIIHEKQPNIICGYNIFTFDIPYMIERAKFNFIQDEFDKQGFDRFGHAKEKTISWSSSAYKNQEFQYLDAEGRIFVDLLPLVRRDFKMDSYSLKNISAHFIGETKDPLTPKGIFKCYDIGKKNGKTAAKAMGIVGKYCVQDSALVIKLFDKLQSWFGLSEMAAICNVQIFDLYSRGQGLKVFSQMYKKCMSENFVVEKGVYTPTEDDYFQGALVYEPEPGIYSNVVSCDFSSLYPSIIIAYNLDYSTLVPENSDIPDEKCNVIEWEEHVGCQHDDVKRKTKPKHILCGTKRYRFLKTHKGLLPSLVEGLLAARKKTRAEIKEIEGKMKLSSSEEEKENYETIINILDKRQLAYKVSANSAYGASGSRQGYLVLPQIAMCTTAVGRKSILKVFDVIKNTYKAKIILSDTDSVYCTFDHIKTTQELWDYTIHVADEITKLFPKPMKLDFEGFIYWRLLTLTKKRYISLKCDRDGVVSKKIEKKGVLLSRRDNSNFVRQVYADIIMKLFYNEISSDEILYTTIQHINNLFSRKNEYKDFVITKSVGSVGDMKPEPIPSKKDKCKIGDYTVPQLAEKGSKKYEQQMKLKDSENEKEFYLRCLPAQVQLAEKMKERGVPVSAGTRLEFVILSHNNPKAKLYEKIESFDYFKEHNQILKFDFMYYLKALAKPLDQVLECTVGKEEGKGFAKKFCDQQMKFRMNKIKMLEELKKVFSPKLNFTD